MEKPSIKSGEKDNKKVPKDDVAAISNLYALSLGYVGYTVTDGSLRTLVMLFANKMGFSAIQIALMFTCYEIMGVVTNLFGGVFASRYGLKTAMLSGFVLQMIGLSLLACVQVFFGELETASSVRNLQPVMCLPFAVVYAANASPLTCLGACFANL